jgi:hypothetical protein
MRPLASHGAAKRGLGTIKKGFGVTEKKRLRGNKEGMSGQTGLYLKKLYH